MAKKLKVSRSKITTIEGLATAMAEGFADLHDEVNGKFAEVHERFNQMNKRFDRIEDTLLELDNRLTAVESKVIGIQRRLDDEAMERVDVRALLARMERMEIKIFGVKQN